ncbi:hypothetical protein J7T55_005859 [Diaporthe amygdali]|uniref:uncharacterized protein n=1 Tax=Phomopsis amygdali TaxID=1214568 RepID=UPI0022FEE93D|nr:uncharacterized protein J7T55_005859 [Diaporthe amygdali]KAJ0124521.1 hypothetical protein J7T55_005859 [Diaporthe amygdali]
MLEPTSFRNSAIGLFGILLAIIWLRRKLMPKPYPGIPYNEESVGRITGDIPNLIPIIEATNEFSNTLFTVTTQKLGVPIAQLLFPGIRKPMVIIEDPREIEDIMVRRNKEFDKAPMAIDMFAPMFPHATLSQYTTPELRAQKRLWQDVMNAEFLRRAAAPNIHKAALELVDLWRLKAASVYNDQAFKVHDDLKDAALDAMWVAVVGEEPGLTRYNAKKLEEQLAGDQKLDDEPAPRGAFLKEEVRYIGATISKNSNHPLPKWAQKFETYTPRYRKFRRTVLSGVERVMKKAVERFQLLETGQLESDALDQCMMDLVLRRQILEARKAGKPPSDPTKDIHMLDELFVMLVAGHDSTANAITWFLRFMESNPSVQSELRAALRAAFPGPDPPTVNEIIQTEIPYLDGACEEGLRLAGTAKAMLRQAVVDTQVLGCPIPKGTEVFLNLHINRQPAPIDEAKRSHTSQEAASKRGDGFQGPAGRDLGRFEPKRWLVKGESGKEVFNPYALPSLAFGGGYRGCFGRRLATMEYRFLVVLLTLNFELLPLPEDLRGWTAQEKIFRHPDYPYARLKIL